MNRLPSLLSVHPAARQAPEDLPPAPVMPTRTHGEGNALVCHNGGRYHNRPLFINNTNAFVLAGDRPIVRLGRGPRIYGAWMIALVRGEQAKWLHLCDDITAAYRAGRMSWRICDAAFAGATLSLEIVPMAGAIGMTVRLVALESLPGDRLVWAYGSTLDASENSNWNITPANQKQWFADGFAPEECRGSVVQVRENGVVSVGSPVSAGQSPVTIAGRCSAGSAVAVGDAAAWRDPLALAAGGVGELPLACGITPLEAGEAVLWAVEAFDGNDPADLSRIMSADEAFAEGVRRSDELAARVVALTPEPQFDAVLSCTAAEMDGGWYPPVFVHDNMAWNVPFPGWQMIFGGTVCGWHDRVKAEAAHYIASQVTESDKAQARADPGLLLCVQHPDSRFYGCGRIARDQGVYNMQTQFFDQIVYDWRWTADPELENLLRPALDLHLEWARACFDPDGDGLYESYINTWPTDSVWYNGGGSVEETAYVFRGHQAARDMARRAGDAQAVAFHSALLDKIKSAFLSRLWIPRRGHAGAWIEQAGHRRLHQDPWLYSICLPIDAGMVTAEQAAESLYYTEWGLQNDPVPVGGRRVWTSNWVPGIWSVRPLGSLDYLNLSLAYFQAGFAEDGWDILKGDALPACDALAATGVGRASLILRVTLEGLFGIAADYPNGSVRVAPHLPADWDSASLRTPDVALRFERSGDTDALEIELKRPAAMEVVLPVRARRVTQVTADGRPVGYEIQPGFGHTLVRVSLPESGAARVAVTLEGRLPQLGPVYVRGQVGQEIALRTDHPETRLTGFSDPEGVLLDAAVKTDALCGHLARPELGAVATADGSHMGRHTVIAKLEVGALPQWQLIRLTIDDPAAVAAAELARVQQIPDGARWRTVSVGDVLNADVRTIYRQQYLSPRPNTVSVRIGSDGYSPWTFPFWKDKAPEIRLDAVPQRLSSRGELLTPQGVPFVRPGEDRNIAFTSLWDNWPTRVTVPVGQAAEALWLLICGSTNPMQCHIANAVVTLRYADGHEDALELVPPFNYWTLCPLNARPNSAGQEEHLRSDYNYGADAFCMPLAPPPAVQLGENCRALVLNRRLRPGVRLQNVTLETLSQDVVVGLMGLTLMNPEPQS